MNETNRALTFGQVADEYDRWRPNYPEAAVEWLAPEPPAPGSPTSAQAPGS